MFSIIVFVLNNLISYTVGDAQTWSPRSYSSSSARNQVVRDPEDVQYHSKKSNVLVRVKEKARRWRHGFIKKNSEGDNTTPSWGVGLEDDEDNEDEDPEYLGAPSIILNLFTVLNKKYIYEFHQC